MQKTFNSRISAINIFCYTYTPSVVCYNWPLLQTVDACIVLYLGLQWAVTCIGKGDKNYLEHEREDNEVIVFHTLSMVRVPLSYSLIYSNYSGVSRSTRNLFMTCSCHTKWINCSGFSLGRCVLLVAICENYTNNIDVRYVCKSI